MIKFIKTSRSSTKKAFTLVELLVVISIIALLLSILMPSLSRAREQARTVKCKSNLSTASKAELIFATENNGRTAWTRGDKPGNSGFYWAAQLWALFHGTTIPTSNEIGRPRIEDGWLRCPSERTLIYPETATITQAATVWNDVQIADMSVKKEKRWWLQNICYSRNFVQADWCQPGAVVTAQGRLDNLKNPSSLVDIIDGSDLQFVGGQVGIGPMTYKYAPDGSLSPRYSRLRNSGCVASYRHGSSNALNVLLWDGHVESAVNSVEKYFRLGN